MADFDLKNDWVLAAPIITTNDADVVKPAPAGDVFSVSVEPASAMNAVVGTMPDAPDVPAVIMNALVPTATGVRLRLMDSAGLEAHEYLIDIVEDNDPTRVALNFEGATHTIQPVPAAPAPEPEPTPPIDVPPPAEEPATPAPGPTPTP